MPKPTYALVLVQAAVKTQGVTAFAASAINGGAALGMTTEEMIQLILSRNDKQCYKTMPSTVNPAGWQDVYHWPTPNGKTAYVKFSLDPNSYNVLVSFKEK